MLKFNFDREGHIGAAVDSFRAFNQPQKSIPSSIADLTGITDEMVAGKRIAEQDIQDFVGDAALIIAHNAAFDRPFCEKLSPLFASYPWACSATEIPWRDEGSRFNI